MNRTIFQKESKRLHSIIGLLLATVIVAASVPGIAGATTFAFKPDRYANPNLTTSSGTNPASGIPEFGFQAFSANKSMYGVMTNSSGWASLPTWNWTGGVATSFDGFRVFNYSSDDWMVEGFDVKNSGSSAIQVTVTSQLKAGGTTVETFSVAPGTQTISLTGHGAMAGSPIYNMSTITFPETIDLSFNNFQLAIYSASVKATVSTTAASSITKDGATSGGNVTAAGSGTVTARGVCWSTSALPTISDSKTADGSGTGSYTSSLTGLAPDTLYYVRAYATSSAGTAYGLDATLTTLPNVIPTPTPASSTWSLAILAILGLGSVVVLQRRISHHGCN